MEKEKDIKLTDDISAEDLTRMILAHEKDIKEGVGDIRMVAHFVKRVKIKDNQFLKWFSDKEYVIVGVVCIAIVAIFMVPDPGNIIMSIVSGMFGLGTGRAMAKDD